MAREAAGLDFTIFDACAKGGRFDDATQFLRESVGPVKFCV